LYSGYNKEKGFVMKEKINEVIEKVGSSNSIATEDKPLIIEKIAEWREEETAISEIALRLENWWMEVEPIFAEMGLV
jgi:predicted nucleic-acid-binding protein